MGGEPKRWGGATRRLWGSHLAAKAKRRRRRVGARGILSGARCCTLQSEQFDRRQRRPAFFWRLEHGERRLRKPTRAAVCRLVEEEETGACKGVRWEAAVLQGT